jgi:Myotubularin-like phosphatase domain
MSPD